MAPNGKNQSRHSSQTNAKHSSNQVEGKKSTSKNNSNNSK